MRLRHPTLIKAAGLGIAWFVRLWMATIRYRYRPVGPNVDPRRPGLEGRYIYAFWHENILMPAYCYGRPDIHVLISQHADGRLIAEAARHLRFRIVTGSTTRGGVAALRRMVKLSRSAHLAVTPDGPRGPRREVQSGIVYLAARTGLPIVPIGIAFARAWRMSSWDRFALPVPWSEAVCVTEPPVAVPENMDREELRAYRVKVQQALERASNAAEALLKGRRAGVVSPPPSRGHSSDVAA